MIPKQLHRNTIFLTRIPPSGIKTVVNITIRFPEGIAEKLKDRAASSRRSINSEVVFAVERHLEGGENHEATPGLRSTVRSTNRAAQAVAGEAHPPKTRKVVADASARPNSEYQEKPDRPILAIPPSGSKWSATGWSYMINKYHKEPTEDQWEAYQKNKL